MVYLNVPQGAAFNAWIFLFKICGRDSIRTEAMCGYCWQGYQFGGIAPVGDAKITVGNIGCQF